MRETNYVHCPLAWIVDTPMAPILLHYLDYKSLVSLFLTGNLGFERIFRESNKMHRSYVNKNFFREHIDIASALVPTATHLATYLDLSDRPGTVSYKVRVLCVLLKQTPYPKKPFALYAILQQYNHHFLRQDRAVLEAAYAALCRAK